MYQNNVFSLDYVGSKSGVEPLELLEQGMPVFDAIIANAKSIVHGGVGDDAVSFFKGWKLTLKGGLYGKKGHDSKGKAVRKEGSGVQESN
jgi:hypothetical protein